MGRTQTGFYIFSFSYQSIFFVFFMKEKGLFRIKKTEDTQSNPLFSAFASSFSCRYDMEESKSKRGSFSETESIFGDIPAHKRICTTCNVCRKRREIKSNAQSEHCSRSLYRSWRRVCFHSTYSKLLHPTAYPIRGPNGKTRILYVKTVSGREILVFATVSKKKQPLRAAS